MESLQEMTARHQRESQERIREMQRDTQVFHDEYRHVIEEWRKYLFNFIFLLGGVLTIFLSLASSTSFFIQIKPSELTGVLKIFLLALGILVFAIIYSIWKDRELMWGRVWIKGFDFGINEYEKYKLRYKLKKFLWIFFPGSFPEMDGLSLETKKEHGEITGKKYTYFEDFKRRRTDFRVLVYVTRLNSGVWDYPIIFGLLSIFGISISFYAFYQLIVLVG